MKLHVRSCYCFLGQLSLLEDDMTLPHSASVPDKAEDSRPGPNQWFKDHLDDLIDAYLLTGRLEAPTDTAQRSEKGLLS